MRPSFWSKIRFEQHKEDWHQDGQNIHYRQSDYQQEINEENKNNRKYYMQLSFEYTFTRPGDQVFCCYTVPYSYSDMMSHLSHI